MTHEALLRVPPLEGMILDCREKFEQVRVLEIEAREWAGSGRSAANLVRTGSRLEQAMALLDDPDFGPQLREEAIEGVSVGDYLAACRDHEEAREKRNRRVRRSVIAGLSTTTVLALMLAGGALWAVNRALEARDGSRLTEGLQALEKAETYPDVYPDRIFYTAKAIGFSGFSGEEKVAPFRPRKFLATSFWREALALFGEPSPDDFPILVPNKLDSARDELAAMPAYLPFWRSASFGSPVTGIEVTATHLRVGYGDGKVREWELGVDRGEMREGTGQVAASVETSGVQFDGTTVKLKAFGHHADLTCHPSPPTAWAFPEDERVLYVGMEDGSVIAWDLDGKLVGNRNLRAYVGDGWLAFDEDNQQLHGRSSGAAVAFAGLPKPETGEFDPSKKAPFRNSVGMELVFLEPGTFRMGSDSEDASDDETPHDVVLSRGFWLGAYEVTQAEWQAVMGENPSEFKDPLAPVETVDWNLVNEYCRKLTERERKAGTLPEGWSYHLPTEAQWEYACRAGTETEYFFGDELQPDQANFSASAIGETVAVGRYQPNKWGLYDMHGNVREWSWDRYGRDYDTGSDGQPVKDPMGPASGGVRVVRGGGWVSSARGCWSAYRGRSGPDYELSSLGFRVALSSSPPG